MDEKHQIKTIFFVQFSIVAMLTTFAPKHDEEVRQEYTLLRVVLTANGGGRGSKESPGRLQGGSREAMTHWAVPPTKYFVLRPNKELLRIYHAVGPEPLRLFVRIL